jgi:hypothetical protein
MKKRNKYWERDRKYHKLRNLLEENQIAQNNLGYIELDHPIPHGFNAYFILREDIANRDDAWVLQGIINHCGNTAWRKKNTFETVNNRRKRIGDYDAKKRENDQYPTFKNVDEREYLTFVAEAKKWFTKAEDKWGRTYYYVNVPIFYYEVKVEQHYRTKVKVIDNVLLQEEAEIEAQLYSFKDQRWSWNSGTAPKAWVRFWNVSHRREEKRMLQAMIYKGKEDLCFPGNHRHSAQWSWW